ncbi:hypothetical protein [Spirosoma rigui]|uniref:hypothetical protein n=1 Tax=Spirosoma rigui TaxID=564064 RepID=UPI0009B08A3C|nr:hypothetical protein [Spirosoma rigui]
MRFVYSGCLFFALIVSSCSSPTQTNQPNVYYDIAGYVKRQIAELTTRKPLVNKQVRINEKTSRQDTRDINWSRELELFTQADINKPALRSSYQITRPDSLTYQYTLKKSEEKLTVRSLRVQLDSATHQPRRIEAVLQTANPLYSSERHVVMESGANGRDPWQMQQYTVSGFQKLPYFDKNEFAVKGIVQSTQPRP